jgi:hypothetical protein
MKKKDAEEIFLNTVLGEIPLDKCLKREDDYEITYTLVDENIKKEISFKDDNYQCHIFKDKKRISSTFGNNNAGLYPVIDIFINPKL